MRLLPAVALTLAACGGDSGVSAGYFGKTVEPPRDLGKLRPGMSRDEVKKLVPGLKEGKGIHEGDWFVESGLSDVQLEVEFDDDRVEELVVKTNTTELERMLTEAWGAPSRERARYASQESAVWVNAADGWRAILDCLERTCFLHFDTYAPLTPEFFGDKPVPPGAYAKVRVGMPVAEAKQLLDNPAAVEKYVDAGANGVSIIAQSSSKTSSIISVRLLLPKAAKEIATKAWGPGVAGKDPIGQPVTAWFDPASGWRAIWEDRSVGDDASLEFTNYLSLPALLGDSGDGLAAFPTPVLGATREEIEKAYPGVYQAKDEVFELPPTAWGQHWTRVNTTFDDAGTLTALRFGIPYKGSEEAKAEILAFLEKRWGAPRPGEDLGRPILIFRDTPPLVRVYDQTITGEWDLFVGER